MDRRDDFERDDDRDFHGGDRFERRTFVRRISRKDVPYVDYKDLEFLSKALTPQGKLLNRRKTGADAKMQHELRRAIMRARFMALIPYGS